MANLLFQNNKNTCQRKNTISNKKKELAKYINKGKQPLPPIERFDSGMGNSLMSGFGICYGFGVTGHCLLPFYL